MTTRFATDDEISRWDELLALNPDGGNVFQSYELAETKRLNGWTPRYLISDQLAVTVLEKSVFGLGRYWYLPKGPGMTDAMSVLDLLSGLQQFARKQHVFCVKIEPELLDNDRTREELQSTGLIPTNAIQPNNSTVLIDLSPELDGVMASLNQKGRHAIHRAERDGAVARAVEVNDENMHTMYDLLASTASGRFESSLRSYEYYAQFWRSFAANGQGSLFFAYVGDQVVASAYCMYLGSKGLYKDGASIREKTVYGASHLLQWEVIKWMKDRGVTSYDLCGAPPSSAIRDESHPFYGIGRFKTSFNKTVTDYVGCYDFVIRARSYRWWRKFGQRLAISLSWRLKHRQWF